MTGRRIGAIVAAAGEGRRLGRGRKAGLVIAGRTLAEWAIRAISSHRDLVQGVLVVHSEDLDAAPGWVPAVEEHRWSVVAGGASRAESVRRGLAALDPQDWILVHDAARPLLSERDLVRVVDKAREVGAAILAKPVVDSLKRVVGGRVLEAVDRSGLWGAETPQVFDFKRFVEVLGRGGDDVTDEAGWWERSGKPLAAVESEDPNFKITVPTDLGRAELRLEGRE